MHLGASHVTLKARAGSFRKMGVARVHDPKPSSEQFTKLIAFQVTGDLHKPRA